MTLSWYGLSSFKITSTGDAVTIVTDPFSKDSGLTPPRGGADLVLISKDIDLLNNVDGITGTPLIIRNPGEFDIKGVAVRGIYEHSDKEHPTTLYYLEVDGLRIAFFGALQTLELSEDVLDELGDVDILIIPVGGKTSVCNSENAAHIVSQVEPKLVVPCFFAQKGLSVDLETADKFLKEMGNDVRTEDRLTLKAKDLTAETIQTVVLNPQR